MKISYAVPFLNLAASTTPNARSTDPAAALREYGECLTVCFASLRRAMPEADLRLITNSPLPSDICEPLLRWNVRTIIQPFNTSIPTGMTGGFLASLYYLDALSALDSDVTILLDPDIVCTASFPESTLNPQDDIGALPLDYPTDRIVNGLSRAQTTQVLRRLGVTIATPPIHWGGEMYIVPLARRNELVDLSNMAWADTLKNNGILPTCQTEEHLFNCALAQMGAKPLTKIVKRIWTTHHHRTVTGEENAIPLWHLPAEKGRGFRKMSQKALEADSWFWTSSNETFQKNASKVMGITQRNPVRWATDTAGQTVRHVEHFIARQHMRHNV